MTKIDPDKLKEILEAHKKWAMNAIGAHLSRADLSGADLRGADLYGAYLIGANLSGAHLSRANLTGARLSDADLSGADLRGAYLSGAHLSGADLSRANLYGANLTGAHLYGAHLTGADLTGADLRGVVSAGLVFARTSIVPENGAFEGWKKLSGGHVAHLRISAKAQRCNASGRKCRASEAKVLAIYTPEGKKTRVKTASLHDSAFFYAAGAVVSVDDFEPDRWKECSPGIHFYLTRIEAEAHQ